MGKYNHFLLILFFVVSIFFLVSCKKENEEFYFPRGDNNYPQDDVAKINEEIYTLPDRKKAYTALSDGVVYGVVEVDTKDVLDIYLPTGDGGCTWIVQETDSISVKESSINLRTQEDVLLDGPSWELKRYQIKLNDDVDEIVFKWIAFSEIDKEYEEMEEYYHLTIKINKK